MEGSREREREWGGLVPVERSFNTFNGGKKSLIPGRIILQILTMRNSIQDLPPSSKITGFVSDGVELLHEASGHTNPNISLKMILISR